MIITAIFLSSSYVFLTVLCSLSLSLPSLTAISSRNQILSRREEERNWGKRKRSERMNLILKTKTEFPGAISTNECRMPNAECRCEDLMRIAECRMPMRRPNADCRIPPNSDQNAMPKTELPNAEFTFFFYSVQDRMRGEDRTEF